MADPQEKELGKHTYRVYPLGAKKATKLLTRLLNIVGRGGSRGGTTTVSRLGAMLEHLTPEEVDYFIAEFEVVSQVRTAPDKWPFVKDAFEEVFQQNYGELMQWLQFCLEVNFSGFFVDAMKKLQAQEDAKGSPTN